MPTITYYGSAPDIGGAQTLAASTYPKTGAARSVLGATAAENAAYHETSLARSSLRARGSSTTNGPPPSPCEQGGAVQSYLWFNGVEVSNAARTLAYMRSAAAGDCQPKFEVGAGCVCWIQTAETQGPGGSFISPADDLAPWWDSAHPESAEFLGVFIDWDSERSFFDGLASRTVTARLGGLTGAQIGPARLDPRIWKIKGTMIAASCAGMEWGRRWLANTMSGTGCDPCVLGELRVRSSCPPCDGSDNDQGLWYAYEAALTDGPKYAGAVDPDCCCAADFTMEVTCGNPYLYKPPVLCAEATALVPADPGGCVDWATWFCEQPDQACCQVDPPLIGTLATVVTVTVGTGVSNLLVSTYPECPPVGDATGMMTITSLPAGSILVVDSARREIRYTDPDGIVMDGTMFVQVPDGLGIPWVEINACNPAQCLCVGVGAYCGADNTTTVLVETREREA